MSSKPAERISMLSNHLSTAAKSASAHTEVPAPTADGASVLFEATHSLRKMTLNRPRALNALNSEMVQLIQPQLEKWEESPLANVILFKGNGRSFCAGGDVVTLVKQLDDEKTWAKSSEFFHQEYAMDAYIAKMRKPVVSIMHGNTLGGGVGLSCHAPFRIATESTKIAMPETTIGLFPDVGATFFLSRLDGQLGIYLGLTSDRLSGAGAFLAGFASHYVPAERLPLLEARLAELDQAAKHEDVNAAIEEFVADREDLKSHVAAYELVGPRRRAIDVIFAKKTAEEIVAALKALEEGSLDLRKIVWKGEEEALEGLKSWAKKTRETIESRSPTSVKLTLLAVREGKTLDIDEAFMMDLRIATACCSPEVHTDFKTGVTHLLINKLKDRAAWSPATLEEVSLSSIHDIFFSTPPPFANPPLARLSFRHPGTAYKAYPHARFSLPSEQNIKDVVTGDARGSGKYALTKEEVVKKVEQQWKGKVGVREKVEEVVARKCKVLEGETLKWI